MVVAFSSWGDDPAEALAAAVADAAGIEAGRVARHGRTRPGGARRLPDPRPGRGVLHLPRLRARLRDGARRNRQRHAARQRAPVAARGHARAARPAQRRHPEPVHQRPASRPARSGCRAGGDRPALGALERARRRAGRRRGRARRACPRRRRRGKDRARPGRSRRRRGQRRRARDRGAVPAARDAAAVGRRARRRVRPRCVRQPSSRSAAPGRSWPTTSSARSRRSTPRSATSPPGSSTTSSPRRARRSHTRRRIWPSLRASRRTRSTRSRRPSRGTASCGRDESGRWEIFHDVLAGAVLGWKGRHDAERAVERARAEARRRHRRLAFLAFGALVGLALATGLAVFAFSQRSEARDQARSATSGQLVASALSVRDSDPELGIALALEAARIEPTKRAEDALRQALDASRERGKIDTGHPVVGMDVDPSGPRVLAVGDDGVARLYALTRGSCSGRTASTEGRRPSSTEAARWRRSSTGRS